MKKTLTALLVGVLLSANGLLAQSTPLDRDFQSQEDLKLTSAGSTTGMGVYLGPYTANVITPGLGFTGLSVYCVDYDHEIHLNDEWRVNTTSIGTGASDASMGLTRLGLSGAWSGSLFRYQQAAYLASLFDAWMTYQNTSDWSGANKSQVYSGIHSAIWTIMGDPVYTSPTTFTSYFLGLAAANAESFNTNGWYVLTDVASTTDFDGSKQEYLARTTTVTPEPETYLLLLTGLVAVFGVQWTRRRRNGDAVA